MHFRRFRFGSRTAKTALAIMICVLLFRDTNANQSAMISSLAAVFALRQDLSTTISFGKSRIIGNSIGGLLAVLYYLINRGFHQNFLIELLVLPLLAACCIIINDGINNNSGIVAGMAAFLMISLVVVPGKNIQYMLMRILDTFIGTFVAISINFIGRPKPVEEETEIEEDLAVLTEKEKVLKMQLAELQEKINHETNKNS